MTVVLSLVPFREVRSEIPDDAKAAFSQRATAVDVQDKVLLGDAFFVPTTRIFVALPLFKSVGMVLFWTVTIGANRDEHMALSFVKAAVAGLAARRPIGPFVQRAIPVA
jgi:hypothetical protein